MLDLSQNEKMIMNSFSSVVSVLRGLSNTTLRALKYRSLFPRQMTEIFALKVGNWGFPFEPLMMKSRFKKSLASISGDLKAHGEPRPSAKSIADVKAEIEKVKDPKTNTLFRCHWIGNIFYFLKDNP